MPPVELEPIPEDAELINRARIWLYTNISEYNWDEEIVRSLALEFKRLS